MRFIGLILLLAGLAVAFGERALGYPFGEFYIGRYHAVSSARNFNPILVTMREDYAPLGVSLEVKPRAGAYDVGGESVLTLHVSDPDGQVTDQTLRISPKTAYMRDDGTMLLENSLTVDPLKSGVYTFQLGDGERDDLGISEIVLTLKGHAGAFSLESRPVGYALIVAGCVFYLIGGRRRRGKGKQAEDDRPSKTSSIGYRQPSEPEPQKRQPDITWGRDGDRD
ncbi:hypothetical protein [Oricola sp.]|uniref:hypothetical protein n=1 Tax=Oricola sp. TaxID=1979950 RepID=UPI003519C1BC